YGLQIMSLGLLVGERQTLNPNPELVGQMITFLLNRVDWGGADVVLLDMPPGTGQPLGALLEADVIDGVVLIAIRETLAHLDNGRLISLLKTAKVPVLGVVENMTHVICTHCGELIELYPSPAAEQSIYGDVPVLASVPFHPQ